MAHQVISQHVSTDLAIELLEVAFNNILYSRKLYPEEAFVEKKMYSTAVHVCQHPEVIEYLGNALRSIGILLVSDPANVVTVNLNIVNSDDERLVEKYVFNIKTVEDRPLEEDPYFLKIEEQLRTICLKLSMATSYLKSIPDNSTFTIDVETSRRAYVAFGNSENAANHKFPWIPADRESINHSATHLIPLTCFECERVGMELYVLKIKQD